MWCAQTDIESASEREQRDDERGSSRRTAAARTSRPTSATGADEREERDVDDGVSVEPEEVLVGDRPAGSQSKTPPRAGRPAAAPARSPARERRQRPSGRSTTSVHVKTGMPQHRHARRAQAQDRDEEAAGEHDLRQRRQRSRRRSTGRCRRPESAGAGERVERRPARPAAPSCVRKPEYMVRPPARIDQSQSRASARGRRGGGADLQRDEVDAERKRDRHDARGRASSSRAS